MGVLGTSPHHRPTTVVADPSPHSIHCRNRSQHRRLTPRRALDNMIGGLLQDIPSDLTVEIEGMRFHLHKFPFITRSAWVRKKVVDEKREEDGGGGGAAAVVVMDEMPGGAEALVAVARFCYGLAVEITEENVVGIRCAAEFLEMEEGGGRRLVEQCESFVAEALANASLNSCIAILRTCSVGGRLLLAAADRIQISWSFVDAIAQRAMEQHEQPLHDHHQQQQQQSEEEEEVSHLSSWWAAVQDELCALDVQMFSRVSEALSQRGLRYDTLSAVIVRYAQRSLEQVMADPAKRRRRRRLKQVAEEAAALAEEEAAAALEEEEEAAEVAALEEKEEEERRRRRRIYVESIVSLLPPERNSAPLSFLFSLLRSAIFLDTTIACRLNLERRIALLLPRAAVSDLLIPSFLTFPGDTIFDVDTVRRIVAGFLRSLASGSGGAAALSRRLEDFNGADHSYDDDQNASVSALLRVGCLIDKFLSEIAADGNLRPSKFLSLAEILPKNARIVHDCLYRAIDIYLKTHPDCSDDERKKICSVLDCRKLSQEASTHAAQNDRLPVNLLLQILHCEQMRLRSVMRQSPPRDPAAPPPVLADSGGGGRRRLSERFQEDDDNVADDQLVAVLRENQMLKMEMAKMQQKLVQKKSIDSATAAAKSRGGRQGQAAAPPPEAQKPPPPPPPASASASAKFLLSMSRKLNKLNPFQRGAAAKEASSGGRETESRRRRHSIS